MGSRNTVLYTPVYPCFLLYRNILVYTSGAVSSHLSFNTFIEFNISFRWQTKRPSVGKIQTEMNFANFFKTFLEWHLSELKTINFGRIWVHRSHNYSLNITEIVNITINEDSFTLGTIVRDLAHNILLAI